MARIKIKSVPKSLRRYALGGEECPPGYTQDQFGNCVPDFNSQPAQQGFGTGMYSNVGPSNSNAYGMGFSNTTPTLSVNGMNANSKLASSGPDGYSKNYSTMGFTPTINQAGLTGGFDWNVGNTDIQGNSTIPNAPVNPNAPKQYTLDPNQTGPKIGLFNCPKGYVKDATGKCVPKEKKNSFSTTMGNIGRGISAFGPAAGKLAMGVNYLDNMKEQKAYDLWHGRMKNSESFTALDTSKNRGDYDINNGIFRPDQMGYKSKGTQANAYYPQQNNLAAFGMEIASNMQPRYVSDVFTPSTYTAAPYIPHQLPATTPSSAQQPAAPQAAPQPSGQSVNLTNDFTNYAEKAQKYISKVNPKTDITGEMLAAGAQKAFEKTGKIVPVELALAQLQQEGYLAKGSGNKPQRTRNPFNYGNTDDGSTITFSSLQQGVDKYYNLIAKSYLKNKDASDLLNNFVNSSGNRYASAKNYESSLKNIIKNINKTVNVAYGGEPIKTNTMKIRIAGVPGRKVRIVGTPDQQEMKDGGQSTRTSKYTGQSSGYGLNLGHRTVYADQPDNPYSSASKTLQPVPRDKANIEAEKGETVYGDIDGDGQNEHMNIAGKRHVDGGTPLNVPEGAFIYSDTNKMRIKDPEVLKFFGVTSVPKIGITPATIAKKYDINKYKAILQDPNTDKLAKETAEKMIQNYEQKLGYLALIQESMKGFPQGIPAVAEKVMGAMQQGQGQSPQPGGAEPNGVQEYPEGQEPQQQGPEEEQAEGPEGQNPEEEQMEQEAPVPQRWGGSAGLRRFINGGDPNDPLGISQMFSGANPATPGAAPATSAYNLPAWYKPWVYSNTKKGRTSPKGPSSTYNYVQGNPVYDDYQYWRGQSGRDFNNAADYQKYVFDAIQKGNPDAYKYMEDTWGKTAAGRYDDSIMGARTMYMAGQRIKPPVEEAGKFICMNGMVSSLAPGALAPVGATVYSTQAEAEAGCKTAGSTTPPPEKTPPPGEKPPPPGVPPFTQGPPMKNPSGWTQQDINSLGNAYMSGALIKKYHPYRQSAQPVLPSFIPKDWRGYAGTLTGQQNADMQMLANFRGAQGLGSTGSAMQGQRAGDLAKYISGVDEYNAQGATAMDAQRADILNKFTMYNKENVGKNVEDENIMDSKFKAALAASLKGITAAKNQGITHAGQIYNTNMTSPYYKVDPRNQMMHFDPRGGYAAFMAQTQGGYQAPQVDGAAYSKTMKDMYDQLGYISDPKERQAAAEKYAHAIHFGNKTTNTTYAMNPGKNRTINTGYNPTQYADPSYAGIDPSTGLPYGS
jgi:hypothetical protein